MTNGYIVDYVCHKCGETHPVAVDFHLEGGPMEAGSLDELYPNGILPPAVVRLLGDLVWCDQAGEYIELEDPARVILVPLRSDLPLEGRSHFSGPNSCPSAPR